MAKRNTDSGREYTVGFAKPPRSGQFKKGESGNPKGRPKGSVGLHTLILKASRERVRANGPDGIRMVSKLEAAAMQLSNKSAQGDLRAARDLFALVQRAEEAIMEQPNHERLSEADRKMMERMLERMQGLTTEAYEPKESR
jgi:hypothetical protein